jgi:large subunit ribosomal protein L10
VKRSQKQETVAALQSALSKAAVVVVVQQSGMTVAESTDLRRRMRAAGAGFKVAKNRLARLALKGTVYEGNEALFKGPTAIGYSADPVAAPKVLVEYAKANEKIKLIGGALGPQTLTQDGVKALASLPSLNELRGKLIGLLQAPATKVAGVLQAPAGQLARVVAAYAKKDEAA